METKLTDFTHKELIHLSVLLSEDRNKWIESIAKVSTLDDGPIKTQLYNSFCAHLEICSQLETKVFEAQCIVGELERIKQN